MKRNKELITERRRLTAVFLELKRQEPDFHWRKAIVEISEIICMNPQVVAREMTCYNKSRTEYV